MANRPWQRHYDYNVPLTIRYPRVPVHYFLSIPAGSFPEKPATNCKEKLAAYKAPKMVEFRSELPKSAVGKILRKVLRDEEAAKTDS